MMPVNQLDFTIDPYKGMAKPSINDVTFAKPTEEDLESLVTLINTYARRGDLLPRTVDSIRETMPDWWIAKVDGVVIACGSLLRYSPKLAEVRSLAVADIAQGTGIGRKLVDCLIDEAKEEGIPRLFALTRVVKFFQKLNFTITERENFPDKIWKDCSICPLINACDETAVHLYL